MIHLAEAPYAEAFFVLVGKEEVSGHKFKPLFSQESINCNLLAYIKWLFVSEKIQELQNPFIDEFPFNT